MNTNIDSLPCLTRMKHVLSSGWGPSCAPCFSLGCLCKCRTSTCPCELANPAVSSFCSSEEDPRKGVFCAHFGMGGGSGVGWLSQHCKGLMSCSESVTQRTSNFSPHPGLQPARATSSAKADTFVLYYRHSEQRIFFFFLSCHNVILLLKWFYLSTDEHECR